MRKNVVVLEQPMAVVVKVDANLNNRQLTAVDQLAKRTCLPE